MSELYSVDLLKMGTRRDKNIPFCDAIPSYTVIYFHVTLSQNYKQLLKPFIFLSLVFVENKTCKYILENPQSKLCNIRQMEMNNNGNNEKCAVNDDTTSDNSMIPIISPTSPKEGRKIVFINENERPHKKYRIESKSEEVIEQENEDIDKLKSTIKRKSEKNKRQKN